MPWDEIAKRLIELFPQVVFILVAIFAIRWVIREYTSTQKEGQETIKLQVHAQLYAMTHDVMERARQAQDEILKSKNDAAQELQEIHDVYRGVQELSDERKRIEDLASDVHRQIDAVYGQIPILAEAAKTPANVLVSRASDMSNWSDAAPLLHKVEGDPEAASQDLEIAGDVARRFRQYALALRLYVRATEKDPDNTSARFEQLCILATMDCAKRVEALAGARQLLLENPAADRIRRLSNVYYHLDRKADLKELCLELIRLPALVGMPGSQVQVKRDLAVISMSLGDNAEAERWFTEALAIDPTDENLLSAFVKHLKNLKKYDTALPWARRLLETDPLDPNYYKTAGELLEALHRYDDAITVYQSAVSLNIGDGFDTRVRKAYLRKDIHHLFDDAAATAVSSSV